MQEVELDVGQPKVSVSSRLGYIESRTKALGEKSRSMALNIHCVKGRPRFIIKGKNILGARTT